MIYYMSTKTLVEEYAKVFSPELILGSTFALFSSRVIPMTNQLNIPYQQTVFFGLGDDLYRNIEMIRDGICENARSLGTICKLVRGSLAEPNSLNVILSTPREIKTKYPYYMAKTIEDMFGYPIIDFHKGRYDDYSYNPKKVYKKLQYWSTRYNRLVFMDHPEQIKTISAKERKNMVKILGLYQKGMDKDEIVEILTQDDRLPFQ